MDHYRGLGWCTLLLAPLLMVGCAAGVEDDETCGDGVCLASESVATCPQDCAYCGDGVRNLDESCDGGDFGEETCESMGHGGGVLQCNGDCTINDAAACCDHNCDNLGETRCLNAVVQECQTIPAGCRRWRDQLDCELTGEWCQLTDGAAGCVGSCEDECTDIEQTQCAGTVVQLCEVHPLSGCLVWVDDVDCDDTGELCEDASGTAECLGDCVDECTTVGAQRCEADEIQICQQGADLCTDWITTDDCTLAGQVCNDTIGQPQCCNQPCLNPGELRCSTDLSAIEVCTVDAGGCIGWQLDATCGAGLVCSSGGPTPQCVTGTGENCAWVLPLTAGVNTVLWSATANDYMTGSSVYSCATHPPDGPDVVMSFTATVSGHLDIVVANKPLSTRWVLLVSSGPCGTLAPEDACVSEYSTTDLNTIMPITAGTTYFFYIVDTTSGNNPLNNPLDVVLTEIDCSTFQASPVALLPAHNTTTTTLSPTFTVDFDLAPITTAGTVTITGDQGTNLSYAVATAPEITFSNGDQTMTVDPGQPFGAGENLTIGWTGLVDNLCGNPVTSPPWDVAVIAPSCQPGSGGVVGSTQSTIPSGLTTTSENYVAVDTDPNGWVYMGSASMLYRIPKAGGTVEDIELAAGLTSIHLGQAMLVSGNDIFTIESSTTGTTGKLWRISSNGGNTWQVEDFAVFPTAPAEDFRAATVWNGRIYLVTHEGTTTTPTEIWSVSANPSSIPDTAVLEGTFVGEGMCSAIAADDFNFYMACASGERIIRVAHADAPSYQPVLINDTLDVSSTSNSVFASDLNTDGVADVLYVHTHYPEIHFACDPSGPLYFDQFGSVGSVNYGMGYDPVANTLWFYDDGTKDFVSLQ